MTIGRLVSRTGVVIATLGLIVFFSLMSPVFPRLSNFVNIGRQITLLAVASFGMTFIIISGEIDLSVGAVAGLIGILAAMMPAAGIRTATTVAVGLAAGIAIGTAMGALIVYGGIPSFIASLGVYSIIRGVAFAITDGRAVAILDLRYLYTFAEAAPPGVPAATWYAGGAFLVLHLTLSRTTFGARVYAVGGNAAAARYSGLGVNGTRLGVFALGGASAALGGILLSARLGTGFVEGARNLDLDAIAAVVLGGTSFLGGSGSLMRTMSGVLLIGVLNNGLNLLNVPTYYQISLKGLIIIASVAVDRYVRGGRG